MHPALSVTLSVCLAVPVAFTAGFLFSPDPTGLVPLALALVLTLVLAPVLYRVFQGGDWSVE